MFKGRASRTCQVIRAGYKRERGQEHSQSFNLPIQIPIQIQILFTMSWGSLHVERVWSRGTEIRIGHVSSEMLSEGVGRGSWTFESGTGRSVSEI